MSQPAAHYRPEIDGLRGVAILAVLANHIDSRLLPGGYVGVDVFFVISGYLITSILLRDAMHGSLSFSRFYARRVRRLLPAASVMSVFVMVAGSAMLLPREFKDLGASLVAYAAMASNVLFWRWDDYFAGQTRTWPLLHTWSLAVEEQFYLVFPWLVAVLSKRSRMVLGGAFLTMFAASFWLSVWQSTNDARSAYYLLPSRSWELLAGALCALVPADRLMASSAFGLLGLASAACVLTPMAVYSEHTRFPGWAALVPVLGTVGLILVTSRASSFWRTLLATRALVWVGLVSYSLYLWHWPILSFARYPWSGMAGSCPLRVSALAGIASLLVAWLSYRFVETPGRAIRLSDGATLLSWAGIGGVTIACGLVVHRTAGLPQRLPENVVRLSQGMSDWQTRHKETIELPIAVVKSGVMPRVGRRDTDVPPDFALWGDSHADALVPAFDDAARERGLSGIVLTRGATPPLLGIRYTEPDPYGPNWAFPDAAIERIRRERPRCVVLAALWSDLMKYDLLVNDHLVTDAAAKEACVTESLNTTLTALFDAGVEHVWILEEVPSQRFNVPKQLALQALFGWQDSRAISEPEFRQKTAPVAQIFKQFSSSRVATFDLAEVLKKISQDGLLIGEDCVYCDHSHISNTAARAIASHLGPIFATCGSSTAVDD